jgi:hypothetical protein
MTRRNLESMYGKYIKMVDNQLTRNEKCMKRPSNNPDFIYLLGNKCIKPNGSKHIKRKKYTKLSKSKTHKRVKKRRNSRTYKGGGLYGNIVDGYNTLSHGLQSTPIPASSHPNPWAGQLTYSKI